MFFIRLSPCICICIYIYIYTYIYYNGYLFNAYRFFIYSLFSTFFVCLGPFFNLVALSLGSKSDPN